MSLITALNVNIAAFALEALITLTSALVRRSYSTKKQVLTEKSLYKDADGEADEKSQGQYSNKTVTIISTICVFLGFAVSLTHAILRVINDHNTGRLRQSWVEVGIWIFIGLQRIQILGTRDPIGKFVLSAIEALSLLLAGATTILPLYQLSQLKHYNQDAIITVSLYAADLLLALVGLLTDISVQRRPALRRSGRPVDGQWTSSFFNRYTYGWFDDLLKLSASGHQLQADDLPALDHMSRAGELLEAYERTSSRHTGGMVKLLILAHWRSFVAQYTWTAIDAVCLILPQLGMYNLLKLLERRDQGEDIVAQATFWVLGLGFFVLLECFTSNGMWWINYGSIGVRFRPQLTALIYTKAIRKKNVQGAPKKDKKKEEEEDVAAVMLDGEAAVKTDVPVADVEKEEDSAEDAENSIQKSRQGVINLIGVDTARVTNFALMNFMFLGSASRLALSFTFLGILVGPVPLLSGVAAQLLFLPANIYFSKKYTSGQEILMKVRDKKLAVLNEALGGMRQIKFSALERQWHKKISNVREEEVSRPTKI